MRPSSAPLTRSSTSASLRRAAAPGRRTLRSPSNGARPLHHACWVATDRVLPNQIGRMATASLITIRCTTRYTKSAQMGNVFAQVLATAWCRDSLFCCTLTALCRLSPRRGADWCLLSGFGVGQVNLGCCYESGNGCKQDTAQAVHWYRKAAEQGNKDALFNLGRCYQRSADESQTGGSHSNDHDSTHVSLDVSDEGSDYVSMDMSQYSSASETANDISESSMRSVRSSHSRPSHSRCRSQKLPSSVSPKLAFSVSPQASKQNTVSPQATKQNTKRPV